MLRGVLVLSLIVLTLIVLVPLHSISVNYVPYEKLSEVKWDDVQSGRGLGRLGLWERLFESKSYENIGEGLISFRYNPDLIRDYEYVGMSTFTHDPGDLVKKYKLKSKPYRLLGYSRTKVDGDEMVVLYVAWKIPRDDIKILLYVVPKIVYEQPAFEDRIRAYFIDVERDPLMPIIEIASIEKCLELAMQGVGYCNWYWSERFYIKELAKQWVQTGYIPVELSEYPLLVNW